MLRSWIVFAGLLVLVILMIFNISSNVLLKDELNEKIEKLDEANEILSDDLDDLDTRLTNQIAGVDSELDSFKDNTDKKFKAMTEVIKAAR